MSRGQGEGFAQLTVAARGDGGMDEALGFAQLTMAGRDDRARAGTAGVAWILAIDNRRHYGRKIVEQ